MSSSRSAAAVALLFAALWSASAHAQQAQGFALERFYPSAAGGGWFVMDDLDMHGGFGGAMELTLGYAHDPLDLTSGGQHLVVVSDEAFADIGLAATYDRFRLSLNLDSPIAIEGSGGTVNGYQFTAPTVTLGNDPDAISDARVGFDARILGRPDGPFRFGAGAQLLIPSGSRSDYDTDGTVRAMFRLLFAGDAGRWIYAGQLGLHLRPLNDSPIPGSPDGSELLFGVAGGPKFLTGPWAIVVGPEVFGETALQSFFGGTTTGLEALLTGRLEGTGEGAQLRVKVGAGGGLDPNFGAPEWRLVVAIELFSHRP
jgi:hypothetical protein